MLSTEQLIDHPATQNSPAAISMSFSTTSHARLFASMDNLPLRRRIKTRLRSLRTAENMHADFWTKLTPKLPELVLSPRFPNSPRTVSKLYLDNLLAVVRIRWRARNNQSPLFSALNSTSSFSCARREQMTRDRDKKSQRHILT